MSDYDAEDLRQRSLSSNNTFEGMVDAHLSRYGFLVVAATAAAASQVFWLVIDGQ